MKKRGLIAILVIVFVTAALITLGVVYKASAQETRPSGTVTKGWFISPDEIDTTGSSYNPCPEERSYMFVLRIVEDNNPKNSGWIAFCVSDDNVPGFEEATFEP